MPKIDFQEVVKMHYRNLYRFACHLASNETDAGDLTQHAFYKFAQHVERFEESINVKSWLYTTLYRRFIDQTRKAKRVHPTAFETLEHLEAPDLKPQGQRVDHEILLDALAKLDPDSRAVLSLYYLESFTYREIAETLDIPSGTVMSRLHRAKCKLYQLLGGDSNRSQTSNDES